MAQSVESKVIRGRRNAARYVGLGKIQTWILQRRGEFQRPLLLSKRALGWLREELDEFIASRAADRDDQRSVGSRS